MDSLLGIDSPSPVSIQSSDPFLYLEAGSRHTCAITADGNVVCWGDNDRGQLGDGNLGTDSGVPVPAVGHVPLDPALIPFQLRGVGAMHSCVPTSEAFTGVGIACWGANDSGQLGNGASGGDSDTPVHVALPPEWADPPTDGFEWLAVSGGASHTCAYSNARTSGNLLIPGVSGIWCWGLNDHGQLGDGTTANASAPRRTVQGF